MLHQEKCCIAQKARKYGVCGATFDATFPENDATFSRWGATFAKIKGQIATSPRFYVWGVGELP